MRITHRMMAQSVSRNVRDNLYLLEKRAVQLSSGHSFTRPSHDPAGVYKTMRISGTGLYRNEQYQRNIGEGITWLTVTEDAFMETIDIVQRLKDLAIYAATGSITPEDREKIRPEVEENLQHLIGIGNTEVGGLYVFGGHQTQDPPFGEISPANVVVSDVSFDPGDPETYKDPGYPIVAYGGDEGKRNIEITPSQELAINFIGKDVFGGWEKVSEVVGDDEKEGVYEAVGGHNLLATVSKMIEALKNNDAEALGGEILQEMEGCLDHLLQHCAEIGARSERLQSTEQRLKGEHIHLRELRSKIEDLDLAEAITEFTMQRNAYMAALSTGAQMIYPSLVDFLR